MYFGSLFYRNVSVTIAVMNFWEKSTFLHLQTIRRLLGDSLDHYLRVNHLHAGPSGFGQVVLSQ